MNIVVLDGVTLTAGDISWQPFEELGNLVVYPRTEASEVVKRSLDADVLIVNKVSLTSSVINALPKLKYIGVLSTGYDVVDIVAAQKCSIPVCNVPSYSTNSVAQQVFAHLLNILNHVAHYAAENRKGHWSSNADFCYWDTPLVELSGKTMGIVGFGHIGQAVARIASAFGMKILVVTRKHPRNLPMIVQKTTLDELFKCADVVSLHCPLTPDANPIVEAQRLSFMKSSAVLINTARGGLVCEQELADALNRGELAAYGADVLSVEPANKNNPLLTAKNSFITPHIAWATSEARQRLLKIAAENIRAFISGKPQNVVNN
ncbi:MAG: D-2-hydroxyacid dehydrogenase [Bacteroidaceae bacterium]